MAKNFNAYKFKRNMARSYSKKVARAKRYRQKRMKK